MAPSTGPNSRAWEALTPPLSEWILDAVAAMGFDRMTPVQAATIPLFMGHKDVVVEAVTGSGKTMAFLIPVVEKLLRVESAIKKHHVGAIVVSPTRELAEQIYNVLCSLLSFHGPSSAVIKSWDGDKADGSTAAPRYSSSTRKVVPQLLLGGSTTPAQDLSTFLKRSPNFLVSTPGRLLELLSSPHVHCPQSSFEVLVLDEADRLLDLGFKEDLQKILSRLPKQRRTGLFSASVSDAVDQIIRVGLRNPVKIAIKVKGAPGKEDKRTPASLKMTYLLTPPTHKFPAIKQILATIEPTPQKSIIYFSTCAAVDYWSHILPAILPTNFVTVPLHGKHPQNVRQKNFTRFVTSVTPSILLTTDVAARGLDIPTVDLVIQVDPPTDPKAYLHRCGRAGRAGRRGLSIILLCPGREEDYVPFLEVRKTPATPLDNPSISFSASDATSTTSKIRDVVLRDRALHDKAQRAFVSWVRSYSKHQASSIFRVSDLSWEDLGHAWGLLKLPRMPELQKFTGDTRLGLNDGLDWDNYAYRDKQREEHRREALNEAMKNNKQQQQRGAGSNNAAALVPQKRSASSDTSVAWSRNLERKDEKERRREKKRSRREREQWEKMTEAEREKVREMERMLGEVRKVNQEKYIASRSQTDVRVDGDDVFEGFD